MIERLAYDQHNRPLGSRAEQGRRQANATNAPTSVNDIKYNRQESPAGDAASPQGISSTLNADVTTECRSLGVNAPRQLFQKKPRMFENIATEYKSSSLKTSGITIRKHDKWQQMASPGTERTTESSSTN